MLCSQVTLWGVPGDPRHDTSRGWECVAGGVSREAAQKDLSRTSELPEEPFLTSAELMRRRTRRPNRSLFHGSGLVGDSGELPGQPNMRG